MEKIPYEIEVTEKGTYVIKLGEHFIDVYRYAGRKEGYRWDPIDGSRERYSSRRSTANFYTKRGAKRVAKKMLKKYFKKKREEERTARLREAAGTIVKKGTL